MKQRKLLIILILLFVFGSVDAQNVYAKENIFVDSLINEMTLSEKVGQMAQYTLDVLGKKGSSDEAFEFDAEKLNLLIEEYKVGSILNTSNNRAMTTAQWERIVKTIQEKAISSTGIPILYGIDAIHGATYTVGATFFPQQIGMGATFNLDLMKKGAEITAYETKASNIPWTFSPVLDLGRDARWSRMWETYGEDPYLTAMMGVASVKGFQGTNTMNIGENYVASCLKHYVGYGVPMSGKDRTPAVISESELREKHFEPFLQGIQAGALSVMVNSGIVNNVSVHSNKELLDNWLKKDLDFDGVILTDWNDVENLYKRDKIALNFKEAIKLAINAGIDMVMVPYDLNFTKKLQELVISGDVSEDRINDAVKRILRMKYRLNLFERPYWSTDNYPNFGSKEYEKIAKNTAIESITLLKNENEILPLRKGSRILVAGPNANSMRTLNGAWSYSWQGEKVEEFAQKYNTIYESLQNEFGKENVILEEGVSYRMEGAYFEENIPDFEKVVSVAEDVDYIVLVVGENSYCETVGNLNELALSDNQIELAKRLASTKKPVILILNEGRPRLIRKIESQMSAIVQIYLPGNFGGDALAQILSGRANPSGKLPYTYPKYEQGLITYDHKPSQNIEGNMAGAYDYGAQTDIQYPFGYGLSYTTFTYSDLSIDKKEFTPDDTLTISVNVRNTGNRGGKETVMLFTTDLVAETSPDVRRLRAFKKIDLKADEQVRVSFKIEAKELAFVNKENKWTVEKGQFKLQIAGLWKLINNLETKTWNTPIR